MEHTFLLLLFQTIVYWWRQGFILIIVSFLNAGSPDQNRSALLNTEWCDLLFLHCQSNILPYPVCGEVCEIDYILLESSSIKKVDFLHILNTANMFKFFFVNLCLVFRKIHPFHWRRKWQPTPVFLPRKFHGQRSLSGYSPWHHKESDMTEQLTLFTFFIHFMLI